ncbi:MAG: hydroxymethylbilane synthase, partial [Bdellovibrionota bacterium]
MNPPGKLVIAARQSDLARLQAYRVGAELQRTHPGLEIEYSFRASLGDKNLEDPLWKMPEKGVFTEDFLNDLIEGRADLVVHSWKDLPTEARTKTKIVATLPRADVRDLLLFKKDRVASARVSRLTRILTSSPRRAYNLKPFLKEHLPFETDDVIFENVRGNIPTRLKKMLEQDVDGLVVAKAALDRLLEAPEPEFGPVQAVIRDALSKSKWMVLPLSVNPTAAAQGALAVEIRNDRSDVALMLEKIHCPQTFETVTREREILASYGGGCHQKIGVNVLDRSFGRILFLRGLTDAGEVLNAKSLENSLTPSPSESYFPRSGEEATFFERESLPKSAWQAAESAPNIWVARVTAVPGDFQFSGDSVVWTAGLETWKKLAKRGVWVSGSSESLGEREPMRVETLLKGSGSKSSTEWTKLTHDRSTVSSMKTIATYRLKPKANVPDLKGRKHFYWMSSTSFDRAVELNPEIKEASHASGPGHTLDHLREKLGGRNVGVYLSIEDFNETFNLFGQYEF